MKQLKDLATRFTEQTAKLPAPLPKTCIGPIHTPRALTNELSGIGALNGHLKEALSLLVIVEEENDRQVGY